MMSLNDEASMCWYAIHTHANQEARAESNLLAWKVETFVPRYRSSRQNQFRSEPSYMIRPLFPRYIFARFNAGDLSHKVRYTRGVHSIVSVGDRQVPLEDELIEMMMARRGPDGLIRLYDDIKSGDEVVIKGGHFTGFVGVFERRMKDSERVMILLKNATSRVRVVVPETQIVRCGGLTPPAPATPA